MANQKILSIGTQTCELAAEDVVEAMFTTISCRLEARGSGTRFPAVMEELRAGYVKPERAAVVLRELDEIEPELRGIPVSQVVWGPNAARRDDDGEAVNRAAKNTFEYFVDGSGRPLLRRLRESVQECAARGEVLYISDSQEARVGLIGGGVCVAGGIAWMLLGHAYFREWCLRRGTARLPVWTVGMDVVMVGIGMMVALTLPGLRDWFWRHPAVLMTIVLSSPMVWLVVCWRAGFLPD